MPTISLQHELKVLVLKELTNSREKAFKDDRKVDFRQSGLMS